MSGRDHLADQAIVKALRYWWSIEGECAATDRDAVRSNRSVAVHVDQVERCLTTGVGDLVVHPLVRRQEERAGGVIQSDCSAGRARGKVFRADVDVVDLLRVDIRIGG